MAANESVVVDVEDLRGGVGPQLWRKAHYQLVATFLDVKLWQDEGQRDVGPEGAGGKRGNVFDRPPQTSRFGDLRVEPEGPRWRLERDGLAARGHRRRQVVKRGALSLGGEGEATRGHPEAHCRRLAPPVEPAVGLDDLVHRLIASPPARPRQAHRRRAH